MQDSLVEVSHKGVHVFSMELVGRSGLLCTMVRVGSSIRAGALASPWHMALGTRKRSNSQILKYMDRLLFSNEGERWMVVVVSCD
jgi:hypothetical protein